MTANRTHHSILRTSALAAATALTAIGLAACGGGEDADQSDMRTQDSEQMTSDGGGMDDGGMASDGGGMDDGGMASDGGGMASDGGGMDDGS